MGVWGCPSISSHAGTNLQEGEDQSAQPGNIFSSVVDAVGERRRRSSFLGKQQECSTSLLFLAFLHSASSPAPSNQKNLCLLDQTDQKFLCFHLFSFLPVGDSTLSSSAGFVLPLLLAGVWLWAQPGTGSAGTLCGTKLSLEGLSLGSHPQSLKSCRQKVTSLGHEWIYSSLFGSRDSKTTGLDTQCETRPALGHTQFRR